MQTSAPVITSTAPMSQTPNANANVNNPQLGNQPTSTVAQSMPPPVSTQPTPLTQSQPPSTAPGPSGTTSAQGWITPQIGGVQTLQVITTSQSQNYTTPLVNHGTAPDPSTLGGGNQQAPGYGQFFSSQAYAPTYPSMPPVPNHGASTSGSIPTTMPSVNPATDPTAPTQPYYTAPSSVPNSGTQVNAQTGPTLLYANAVVNANMVPVSVQSVQQVPPASVQQVTTQLPVSGTLNQSGLVSGAAPPTASAMGVHQAIYPTTVATAQRVPHTTPQGPTMLTTATHTVPTSVMVQPTPQVLQPPHVAVPQAHASTQPPHAAVPQAYASAQPPHAAVPQAHVSMQPSNVAMPQAQVFMQQPYAVLPRVAAPLQPPPGTLPQAQMPLQLPNPVVLQLASNHDNAA